MKRLSLCLLLAGLTALPAFAQDTATQQQIDKLSGQIQDLMEGQAQQGKRIDALLKEVNDLHEKVNTPTVKEDNASRADLKRIAEQLQEVDRKRAADRELILDNINKLAKVAAGAPVTPRRNTTPKVTEDPGAAAGTPQVGHEYKVQAGDSLGLIVKAYRDQGVKVTTAQVLKANPGLDPNKLYVGKVIFIPDPSAK
jgi:LysM repeat protein